MSEPHDSIESARESALRDLAELRGPQSLEAFRIKYLGTKGKLRELTKLLGRADPADRATLGQRINQLRDEVTSAFEQQRAALEASSASGSSLDITEPGRMPLVGRDHVVTRVTRELCDLFARMGFTVAEGPELEDEWHNFVALNIPESHPARDPLDNFYLEPHAQPSAGPFGRSSTLLRTQTSTVQIRVMETHKPPIRVVAPGRVYRPDTTDATHLPMFHQLEALVVDEHVSMVDLKSTVLQFVRAYFGESTRVRFRPSFFPFTEPSAEVDVWFEDRGRWIELGGCGMVHPHVLRNCGIDHDLYSGWAFGFGIERIAMRKYPVPDIRLLVENDLRFLRQV